MGPCQHWMARLLALGLVAGTAWGQGPGGNPGKSEEEVKKALAAFVKQYSEGEKKKDESMRIFAFDLLNGMLSDQRALDTVAKILGIRSETDGVKTRAAQMLGESGNPKAIPVLVKAFGANERNASVASSIARELGRFNDKSAIKELDKIVRPRVDRFEDLNACAIARAGIMALGRLRFPESVDILIGFLGPIAARKAPKDKHLGPDDLAIELQRGDTEQSLVDALKAATALELGTYEEWKKWWDENKKTWQPQ